MRNLESFIFGILDSKFKKTLMITATVVAFFLSLMMFPTKMVLAKMLPGKSANTFSVYVDTPAGSSVEQTKAVSSVSLSF